MNLEQFLKPEWKKFIIFFIGIIIILINTDFHSVSAVGGTTIIYIFFALPLMLLGYFLENEAQNIVIVFLGWILSLFYLYLISCVVIWIDKRYRKEKKK